MMLIFLTGCSQTTIGDGGFTVPSYTKAQRIAVHGELKACEAPQTIEFLKDYKVLRDQVRVK